MKLKLTRNQLTTTSTKGVLEIDGIPECGTLEDTDRELENGNAKVYGKTAIPRGTYKVIVTYSNRFKKDLPLLVDVPGFTGVRIHSGNKPEDTEGCILTGMLGDTTANWISNSKVMFAALMLKILAAVDAKEDIAIEIV